MSETYKPVPNGMVKLSLEADWCGDDECSCNWMEIFAIFHDGKRQRLWESSWINPNEWPCYVTWDDFRAEVLAACRSYGIEPSLKGECVWDWKGEKVL